MAKIRNFKGLRPAKDLAAKICELPYDVVSSAEAKSIAKGNKYSFFHISKPEIDLPDSTDVYDASVYKSGKNTLDAFIKEGYMFQDEEPRFYLYSQVMDGRTQTGLVACVSIDDYLEDRIKKHELTREDKERDRTIHLDQLNANTGPVFLFFHEDGTKKGLYERSLEIKPEYDITTDDGVRHIFRIITDDQTINEFVKTFSDTTLYIADGHHRAASAVRVGTERRNKKPGYTGNEEFNWFLGVIFPHDQLRIMPYNRAVQDLNGMGKIEFFEKVALNFTISKSGTKMPDSVRSFSMYIEGEWFTLVPKFDVSSDPVEGLDVQILQKKILDPILGIKDPRKDKRIEFIGGIRGTGELEKLVNSGDFAVAFSMYPTTIEQLIEVSDSGKTMPPKSTWFEPKLRSGLVLHLLK